jgi:hypothetical protein
MPPRTITDDQVAQALAMRGKATIRKIADQVGISAANVSNIHNDRFRGEQRSDLDLSPGERRLDYSIRCSGCGGRIDVVPCRCCRMEAKLKMTRPGPAEFCPRCNAEHPTKTTRKNRKQVRCGNCGGFLRLRSRDEIAAEVEAERAAEDKSVK